MAVIVGKIKAGRVSNQLLQALAAEGFKFTYTKPVAGKPAVGLLPQHDHLKRAMDLELTDEAAIKRVLTRYRDDFEYLEPEVQPVPPVILQKSLDQYPVAPPSSVVTPDFRHLQKYLRDFPEGLGLNTLWQKLVKRKGLRGEGISVCDIEGAWNLTHEEIAGINGGLTAGSPIPGDMWLNHGTAVVGLIQAKENGSGVCGIAPAAKVWEISQTYGVVNAIRLAADSLKPGDILILEMQVSPGPGSIYQYVPIEFYPYYYDAVAYAVSRGIVVLLAGANGGAWLDDPVFNGIFSREVLDSGAIYIGACTIDHPHYALSFSSHGTRMDIALPGQYVFVCGYGTYYQGPDGLNQQYGDSFGGTSSATGISALTANINGARKGLDLEPLDSYKVRRLLVQTGLVLPDSSWNPVGVFPNLPEALKRGAPHPDMDHSGRCDFEDYFAFVEMYGREGEFLAGDFNGDGKVDLDDFFILAKIFNEDNPQ